MIEVEPVIHHEYRETEGTGGKSIVVCLACEGSCVPDFNRAMAIKQRLLREQGAPKVNPEVKLKVVKPDMRLVNVEAPHFVAGFETDGVVRRAAPILKYMIGWTDAKARTYIARKGWDAWVVE